MYTHTGTLYGIGVGPGDPELITLKALKVLHRVPHIFAACSTKEQLQPGPEHRTLSLKRRRHSSTCPFP